MTRIQLCSNRRATPFPKWDNNKTQKYIHEMLVFCLLRSVFSSSELKFQVSFSDHLSSIVRFSINFSHFHLLLRAHWTNDNQIWYKAFFGDVNPCLFKQIFTPFLREENLEIAKIHWQNLKIFFSRTSWLISTKLCTKHIWVIGLKFVYMKGHASFQRVIAK